VTREDEIAEAVEALLEVALSQHTDPRADETFTECHLCDQWEGHTRDCPVPLLQLWQKGEPQPV
jgi:hypothetical protein